MSLRLSTLLVVLTACTDPKPGPDGIDTDTDVDTDTDTDTDTDSDTDTDVDTDTDPGTDEDGDGWTVEEGDCNDNDIWTNPAWPEDITDDVDNDCDGRIDEQFSGVLVVDIASGQAPLLHVINPLGDRVQSVLADTVMYPEWVSEDHGLQNWVSFDRYSFLLQRFDLTGVVTEVSDLNVLEVTQEDEAFEYSGLAVHPDGSYLIAAGNRVVRVQQDGSAEVLFRTLCDINTPIIELCPRSIAANRFSGEVSVFGYLGGHGVWTPEDGLEVREYGNLDENWTFWDADYRDRGAAYALGVGRSGTGLYTWDETASEVSLHGAWPNDDFTPASMAIETESDDVYVTANGGWFYTVWRQVEDGTYTGQLYTTDGTDPDRAHFGAGIVWSQD